MKLPTIGLKKIFLVATEWKLLYFDSECENYIKFYGLPGFGISGAKDYEQERKKGERERFNS